MDCIRHIYTYIKYKLECLSLSVMDPVEVTRSAWCQSLLGVHSSNGDKIEGLHSLELPDRDNKTNASRINPETYSAEKGLSSKGKDVIELENANGRTDVRIEVGNTVDQTKGCIFAGKEREGERLKDSKGAMDEIINYIDDVSEMDEQSGETTTIEVEIEENFSN